MEEISLQDVYDAYAALLRQRLPANSVGEQIGYNALYQHLLQQFRRELVRIAEQIIERNPDELFQKETMREAIALYRQFERELAPAEE